jgi:transposase
MAYGIEVRERAVEYVRNGGSQEEACIIFKIKSRKTLYNWLQRADLTPGKPGGRRRKLDKEALFAHVREYPESLLRERASHFGVRVNAVWVALKGLRISKKNDALQGEMPQKPGEFSV